MSAYRLMLDNHAVDHLTEDRALRDWVAEHLEDQLGSAGDGVHVLPVEGLRTSLVTVSADDDVRMAPRPGRPWLWPWVDGRGPEPTDAVTVVIRDGVVRSIWAGPPAPPHPQDADAWPACTEWTHDEATKWWQHHAFTGAPS